MPQWSPEWRELKEKDDSWGSYFDGWSLAFYLLKRNSPFNPMSWIRLWGNIYHGRVAYWDDIAASMIWAIPVWAARGLVPAGTPVGYTYSAMAVTSGLRPSASLVPLVFAGGLLHSMMQMPWWPQEEVIID